MKVKNYIDNNYYLFFGIYFAFCFVLSILTVLLDVSTKLLIIGLIIFLISLNFWYFFYYREYYFDKEYFDIKIGFFRKRFYYKDIKKCYITKNNIPSYATSYQRICIEQNNKKIYISPEKMDEILMLLIRNSTPKKRVNKKKTKKVKTKK